MARVEIEERAWSDPRLKKLAHALRITPIYAMGLLAALWHDSQQQETEAVDDADLRVWFAAESKRGRCDVVAALIGAGYVEKLPDGRLRIDGNARRIALVKAFKDRAKAAGNARWNKDKNRVNSEGKGGSIDAPSMLEDKPVASPKQFPHAYMHTCTHADMLTKDADTSYQQSTASPLARDARAHVLERADASCEAAQLEEQMLADNGDGRQTNGTPASLRGEAGGRRKRAPKPRNASEPTPGAQTVIAAFVTAWGEVYRQKDGTPGKYPVRGPDAGAAKALVKAVGVEKAVELVPAYLGMKTAFLIGRRHPLQNMANDLPAIVDYASSGKLVTSITARKEETNAHADDFVKRYMARDAERQAAKNGTPPPANGPVVDVEAKEVVNDPW